MDIVILPFHSEHFPNHFYVENRRKTGLPPTDSLSEPSLTIAGPTIYLQYRNCRYLGCLRHTESSRWRQSHTTRPYRPVSCLRHCRRCYSTRSSGRFVWYLRCSPVMDPVFHHRQDPGSSHRQSVRYLECPLRHCITRKLLKIDSYMLRGVCCLAQYFFSCTLLTCSTLLNISDWRAILMPSTHASMFM